MACLVVWSERATEDLEEIATYIAQDSEHYARSVIRTILQKSRKPADFPFIGRIVPEFADESIREIFAYSYRIVYKINDDEINIAAVIHGRRLLNIALGP
jgi:addiction module RelE/StbE family toxin